MILVGMSRSFEQKIAARAVPDEPIDLKRKKAPKPMIVSPAIIEIVEPIIEIVEADLYGCELPKHEPMSVPTRTWLLPATRDGELTLNAISQAVGAYFNLPRSALRSHRRRMTIVRPRQICAYLAVNMTRLSLPQIGYQMGDFDHTTILHAARKIAELCKTDPKIDEAVTAIMAKLSEAQ